jgi:hypothetical protein
MSTVWLAAGCVAVEPNHRHRWLLRPRRERPSHHRTAEKRDEFPAMHDGP